MNFPDLTLPRATPVEYIEQQGALSVRPILVHMIEVSDDDIERVRLSGAIVVHCPRSNERLQCRRMPLEKYLAAGVPVLLGTDSLSSSPSIDVREEQAFAVSLHRGWVAPGLLSRMARDASTFESHYR